MKLYESSYSLSKHDHKHFKQLIAMIILNLRNGYECDDFMSGRQYCATNGRMYYVDFNLYERIDVYYSEGNNPGFLSEYKHFKHMKIKLGLFDKSRFNIFSWIED